MKKRLIAVVLMLSILTVAGVATAEHHRGKRLERLQQKLSLTPEQMQQLQPLYDTMRNRAKAEKEAFKASLTPEQQAMLSEGKAKRQRGKWKQLNLSEQQKAELKAMRQRMRAERKAVHEQMMTVLTDEQRQKFEEMKAQHKGKKRQRKSHKQEN